MDLARQNWNTEDEDDDEIANDETQRRREESAGARFLRPVDRDNESKDENQPRRRTLEPRVDIYAIPPELVEPPVSDEEEEPEADNDAVSENEDPDVYNEEDEWGDFYDDAKIVEEATRPEEYGDISFTLLCLFIWVTINNISQTAFQTLVKILKDPEFDVDEIPYSINTLKKLRRRFPLDNIHSHVVPIEKVDGDSKTKSTAICYYFDIKDVIRNYCENPQIVTFCHFGLGESIDRCKEAYHGWLWRESILSSIGEYPISTIGTNGMSSIWLDYSSAVQIRCFADFGIF